jgi:hypothetical protein
MTALQSSSPDSSVEPFVPFSLFSPFSKKWIGLHPCRETVFDGKSALCEWPVAMEFDRNVSDLGLEVG